MSPASSIPQGRRPMTMTEKILCHQALSLTVPYVTAGETVVLRVARTLASELTLVGIKTCLEATGNPELWRKDRFFLACDHSVDPRNYDDNVIKRRIEMCQEFADKHCLTDYFGPNESILHTEFYRQRAVPGTVVVGADSHSCAHGCVGAYSMGMGAADVTMPLVTGMTWIVVPPTVLIEFTGELAWGFCGKDVILHILKLFRRNAVALDRCIEFGGNIACLDIDSRFAISNMATEFGALAGIFPADELTHGFLCAKRGQIATDEEQPLFFRADADAVYAERLTVDLSAITEFTVALWPSPDNVFAISDPRLYEPLVEGEKQVCESIKHLDGCFIGACTTTETEMVLAALLLETMMDRHGMKPQQRPSGAPYKRQVTPGSRVMLNHLEAIGVLDIYRRAGFTVGAPGCSYCLGVGYDRAGEGEVWLSSQNRNFKNRMGKGAIGSITSAAVVAASSFNMTVTDPMPYMHEIDVKRFRTLAPVPKKPICISEPSPALIVPGASAAKRSSTGALPGIIQGKAQAFGDDVDTDAIIPAQYIPLRGMEQGEKSFCIAKPTFVELVKQGHDIVVAGEGFGCGSSREEAASCLRIIGVKAVIAKSFSFIFGRNLLTMNLFGICIKDPKFYELATDGSEIKIDVAARVVQAGAEKFGFSLSPIQEEIYNEGGIISMFCSKGRDLYSHLAKVSNAKPESMNCCSAW